MKLVKKLRAAILAMTLCSGAAAQADTLTFTGSAFAQAMPQPLGSCPVFHSAVLAGLNNSTSSLSSFDYTSNSCVTLGGPVNGTFGIDSSATNGIFGTFSGTNQVLGGGLFSPLSITAFSGAPAVSSVRPKCSSAPGRLMGPCSSQL